VSILLFLIAGIVVGSGAALLGLAVALKAGRKP